MTKFQNFLHVTGTDSEALMASCKSFPDSFVDADPERALEELNVALDEVADDAHCLCQRAYAHILLGHYHRACDDVKKAQQLQPGMAPAFLRRGIAEYHLNNINAARQAFTDGKELQGADEAFEIWLKKCEEIMAAPPIKHDWYQTESDVIVTLLVKNVKKDDVSVSFQEKKLKAMVKLPSGEDHCLDIHLRHPVVPEQSTYKTFSTKVEIKMVKTEAIRWEKLEGESVLPNIKHLCPSPNQGTSSSHHTRSWDKLVREIKEEEENENLEGDAALTKMFQQIYADGSDDVKRAMNKSFMESGGTVLSTNWTEVGRRKVEVTPPDDMEWKKY